MSNDSTFLQFTPESAVDLLMLSIKPESEPSLGDVEAKVDQLLSGPFASLRSYREQIVNEILKRVRVRVGVASVLTDDTGHLDWLTGVNRTAWKFWPRLERFLKTEKDLPPAVVLELDKSTDKTLELLESPERDGQWDRRGLVVGHVQSGKTSHYTALSAKALDAGYQIVIILAGVHNSLRAQTHERIDENLIGRDSAALLEALQGKRTGTARRIGVSALDLRRGMEDPPATIITCTNSNDNGDFKTAVASTVGLQVGTGTRLVMVVKKHDTILRNLTAFLRLQADSGAGNDRRLNAPTLVIDDEADHASINTRDPEEDPTTINRRIRELLISFNRVAFVGYTATPFANIFIPVENSGTKYGPDLFPASFIVNLKPPSDYIGPDLVFGHPGDESIGIPERPALPMYAAVSDASAWIPDKHDKDHQPGKLPPSLKEAIKAFVLVCAARAARGDIDVHNSMLVHASRFVNLQARIGEQIETELNALRNVLGFGGRSAAKSLVTEFAELWRRLFETPHTRFQSRLGDACLPLPEWSMVMERIPAALNRVEVMKINGTSTDTLKYSKNPEGVYVIAVGGDKLSRGLTLEGLSISYFLRTSKMFDTLLQMGRWFGYRPRYADLCRVFTTKTLFAAFRAIALAMEDLRADLDMMAELKKTPLEFGLRVRTPQDDLLITAANKLRRGDEVKVRFANSLIQTLELPLMGDQAQANYESFVSLVERLGDAERTIRGTKVPHFIWRNVAVGEVTTFLSQYDAYSNPSFYAKCGAIRNYIRQQSLKGELANWTVVLVSKKNGSDVTIGTNTLKRVERSKEENSTAERLRMRGVVGSEEEAYDLSVEEYKNADGIRRDTINFRESVRSARPASRGLLLLYPLQVRNESAPDNNRAFIPVVGISFPASETAEPLAYTVNEIWKEQFGLIEEPDEA